MGDFLLEMRGPGRRILKTFNVPLPPTLKRAQGAWVERPLDGRTVAISGASLLPEVYARAGADLVSPDPAPYKAAAEAWSRTASAACEGRVDALVFDATSLETAEDLRQAYDFLHPWARRVSQRVLVLVRPQPSVVSKALESLVRSFSKELGRKGATANLVRIEPGAEDRAEALIRFLLSDRSAFVSGQPFLLRSLAPAQKPSWTRPLDGKRALVTGSARGIGKATARRLVMEGAQVFVGDRPDDAELVEAVAAEIGGEAFLCDVTHEDAPQRVADLGLDIVVHNAGVTRDRTLGKMKPESWDLALAVNLLAPIRITEALDLPVGGRVICLSSIAGIAGNAGQTNYSTSKAGLIGYVASKSAELAERGATINAIAPGFIETRMTAAIPVGIREAGRRLSSLSQGGLPLDIAEVVTFLASPGSSGLTGQVVRVCGQALIGA